MNLSIVYWFLHHLHSFFVTFPPLSAEILGWTRKGKDLCFIWNSASTWSLFFLPYEMWCCCLCMTGQILVFYELCREHLIKVPGSFRRMDRNPTSPGITSFSCLSKCTGRVIKSETDVSPQNSSFKNWLIWLKKKKKLDPILTETYNRNCKCAPRV